MAALKPDGVIHRAPRDQGAIDDYPMSAAQINQTGRFDGQYRAWCYLYIACQKKGVACPGGMMSNDA